LEQRYEYQRSTELKCPPVRWFIVGQSPKTGQQKGNSQKLEHKISEISGDGASTKDHARCRV
jgi:hypothetical protein